MTQQHPITPPPELFTEWLSEAMLEHGSKPGTVASIVAEKAVQWGADQELEACRQWLEINWAPRKFIDGLLAARRPKPPSLKEQALDALEEIDGYAIDQLKAYTIHDDLKAHVDVIRRALELLPDDTTP